MVLLRRCDQFRVTIDTDNVMSTVKQDGTHAPRATASIQDAGAAPSHRVNKARLAPEI
jgi:hypothetical protein